MSGSMTGLVLRAHNQVGLENVPVPNPAVNEVLVRIKSCAICGSDPRLIFNENGLGMGNHPFPFIPGHEASGEVVEIGKNVSDFAVGDRVAIEAHNGCGYCRNCMQGLYTLCLNFGKPETGHRHYGFFWNGAFAEYAAYNIKAVTKIPDGISYDEASMCDTAGTPYNGIRQIGITPGGYAVIVGPGPIGLCAMKIVKSMGARTIMVGRGSRLLAAGDHGCDHLIDYDKEEVGPAVAAITKGYMADEVVECAGTEKAVNEALGAVKRGGRIALVGWPAGKKMSLDIYRIVADQITLAGGRANANSSSWVMNMMHNGSLDVKKVITHKFPLSEYKQAFETFMDKTTGALKVVINP